MTTDSLSALTQDRASVFRPQRPQAESTQRVDARLWRRGPAPIAAGTQIESGRTVDYGYYGPKSIVWKVFFHPTVAALEVPVTALLQFSHAGMSANMMEHDPLYPAAKRGEATAAQIVSRHRRTYGVLVPAVVGNRATADRIGAHIKKFHGHMKGVIPGTDQPYDAAGPELVLYGHVTIMQAALLIYETAAYQGIKPPRRLSDKERDRYWAEAAPFAVLMGAREEDVPRSVAQLHAYYAACESSYFNQPLILRESITLIRSVMRQPAQWRNHPADTAIVAALVLAHLVGIGVLPRPARRHWGIPRAADPVIDLLFRAIRPAFALLNVRRISDRLETWMAGPEGFELMKSAKALMASQSKMEKFE